MYQALYRKWRPLVFADVAGQPHITETLRRQVETGRLSHAYLFTGTRGTGKTTCAKILARAANCLSPVDGDPCNRCVSCLGILDGSIPDIAEIDAASNSGVDNIRSLREESVYTPVTAKKRVYIIDEVHMLSAGAFNALLKTLEEPPAHVMFILATTETPKVPATILSRCQRFAFKRIPPETISARLSEVSAAEGIDLRPDAAALLAGLADGALRDGLSLLDQCASQSRGGPVDAALVREIVGLAGRDRIAELAGRVARSELVGALEALDGLVSDGKELSSILDELSGLMRDALLCCLLPETRRTDAHADALSAHMPRERLIEAILTVQESQGRLPASFNRRLEAELCLIKLCGGAPAPQALPVEAPAQRRPAPESAPKAGAPEKPAPAQEKIAAPPDIPARPEKPPQAEPERALPSEPEPLEAAPPDKGAQKPAGERFRRLLATNAFFKSFLEEAQAEERGDTLLLTLKDPFAHQVLGQAEFTGLVKTIYAGGVEFSSEPPPPEAKKRLSDFKARAGGLITENKSGG